MTPITREIAKRAVTTTYDDLPIEVVDYSKALALSALGATLAGPAFPGANIVTEYVRRAGGTAEATVLGGGFKSSVEAAALANGTYAHATEYEDDSFPEAVSSYTLFPAILALGEHLHADGRAALEAFVLGYEAQARIGLACREARRLGYMVLALAGSIGCAVAGAKLLKLDERGMTNAISIAASQASGLGYQTGSMTHIIEMGFAARNGLAAAFLAADGFTGQSDVLEAPRGLFNLITAGRVEDADRILSEWGSPYRVLAVGIKQYPCCYHLQRIIESVAAMRAAGSLALDEIEEIQVEVNAFFPTVVQYHEPRDEIQAQFSLPHAVAAALLEPRVLPSSFSQNRLARADFREMRGRVRIVVREDWGWAPTGWTPKIIYRLKDGTTLAASPKGARGQPPDLLTFDDCIEKYRGCTEGLLAEGDIATSIGILRSLEACGDLAELIQSVTN